MNLLLVLVSIMLVSCSTTESKPGTTSMENRRALGAVSLRANEGLPSYEVANKIKLNEARGFVMEDCVDYYRKSGNYNYSDVEYREMCREDQKEWIHGLDLSTK